MEGRMSFEEFRAAGQKVHSPKEMKVTNSFGVYDAYKLARKNHWYDIGRPVKEKEFYAIVRGINKYLAENISNGETVKFPEGMGMLELVKYQTGVSIVDGKLKNTYPIDWNKTWELWYNDEEARRMKTLVRDEQKWVYHVRYGRYDATYENKCFYQFTLNRFIKRALKENIKKGKVDTLW